MSQSINGTVVLITGASSGIGRATVDVFAARCKEKLVSLVAEIESRIGAYGY